VEAEEIRDYCLSLEKTEESLPFGPNTLVFKVNGKIFLLLSLDAETVQFNVKCEPGLAIEYRERFPAIQPGYHMNKAHWNTVIVDGSLKQAFIKEMINHSYVLVVDSNRAKSAKKSVKRAKSEAKKT